MSQQDDDSDKQFEPTLKKLEDARKKGEVPRSADLTNAAAYGGFVLIALSVGFVILSRTAGSLSGMLANAPELASDVFTGGAQAQIGGVMKDVVTSVSPWFAGPALAAILVTIIQKSFVFAPSKLEPKVNRISILANAKNKFGRQGLFEFAKSLTKLLIYSAVLGVFLIGRTPEIITSIYLSPAATASMLMTMSLAFIMIVLVVAVVIGALDFFWQHGEHLRKNRMSRKEVMDEAKQMEGDPHIKQQRRQKGHDIAMNQMLADIPKADVVIVNPSHYAVALKWSRAKGSAPVCIAKGVDEIAARIREAASEYGVAIHRDAPTARALFASIGLGEQVMPEHFRAVAAAIRFAEDMGVRSTVSDWKS